MKMQAIKGFGVACVWFTECLYAFDEVFAGGRSNSYTIRTQMPARFPAVLLGGPSCWEGSHLPAGRQG
jgi:hypothetical protein